MEEFFELVGKAVCGLFSLAIFGVLVEIIRYRSKTMGSNIVVGEKRVRSDEQLRLPAEKVVITTPTCVQPGHETSMPASIKLRLFEKRGNTGYKTNFVTRTYDLPDGSTIVVEVHENWTGIYASDSQN